MRKENDFDKFIETFESPNTKKVTKSLRKIGDYDYDNITPIDLEQIVLSLEPNSPKSITTICYTMGLYAKYLGNNTLYHMIDDLDRSAIWKLAKPNARKKFISHSQFKRVCKDIETFEEYNSLYISTLFRCLYEGVYSDDMSVVKNLRASDITENILALNPDNEKKYFLYVSDGLAKDLTTLGRMDTWSRRNRYGECRIKTTGLYDDTCFKVESRNGSDQYLYRFSYYRVLRKVAKEYVGYGLLPLQLFVSGIMYRIKINLFENSIELEDAFSPNNKSRLVNKVISDELKRCGYDIEIRNFREMVIGHIDVFADKCE